MLASIQTISELTPIEGADRIESAKVLGWNCIVRKGLFRKGDKCIYIQIDTLIPKRFLSDIESDTDLIRLKTVKMKGHLSQGLVLPLSKLGTESKYRISDFEYMNNDYTWNSLPDEDGRYEIEVGTDVTEDLGIQKYEHEVGFLPTDTFGNFPNFLVKTDEERIQNSPELLDKVRKNDKWYITTKMDGTSATFYNYNGHFGVCSRGRELKYNPNSCYWYVAEKYKVQEWLPDGFAIQGEVCGFWDCILNTNTGKYTFYRPIQKNRLKLYETRLYIFNIFDIVNQQYVSPYVFLNNDDQISVIYNPIFPIFGVDVVPLEEHYLFSKFNYTLDNILTRAEGHYQSQGKPNLKEGIVVRTVDQSVSFKVINNKFLLKEGE